jgi:hypothetical protein
MKRERLTNLKIFLANFFLARLLCALLIDEVIKILLEFENNDYFFNLFLKLKLTSGPMREIMSYHL